VVWYKSFLYRAASWKTARRVVAKIEFHCGELFPRIGFTATTAGEDRRQTGQTRPVLLANAPPKAI
jgi:hypothetical protein